MSQRTVSSPRRRSGRPPLTDRTTLLAAARGIGFAELTVGAVTEAVGVKYSTFYRHFPTFDSLVSELANEVCAEVVVRKGLPGECWQHHVATTCSDLWQLHRRYPGLAAAVVALPDLPASVVAIYQGLTEVLLAAGFDARHASLGAVYALETVTMSALATPGAGHTIAARQRALETDAGRDIDSSVRAVTAGLLDGGVEEWIAGKIAILIRGLAAERALPMSELAEEPAQPTAATTP